MAETWNRSRKGKIVSGDRYTKTDALAARRVLRDAYRASLKFDRSVAQQDSRLHYVLTVTLLRAVGHALRNIDSKRSTHLKSAIETVWQKWNNNKFGNLIFFRFIEEERNIVLKEYRIASSGVLQSDRASGVAPEAQLLIGDQIYSVKGAIKAALKWWELELDWVEGQAESMRKLALAPTPARRASKKASAKDGALSRQPRS